ncbi:MAG: hypothetical protein IT306_12795 [Chloroflexi bacterium]|nr:hypothetical protein [Chloroflexota bacterium]
MNQHSAGAGLHPGDYADARRPVNSRMASGVPHVIRVPLSTPISGSWLNLAESVQRIIVRRALEGQHPQSQGELLSWLNDTITGWNAHPTPFVWHGKRYERRQRARQRRRLTSVLDPIQVESNAA